MGCDCHGHTEIKVGGVWHHYGNPRIPRSYALFAKLAGVRGDERPIAEPRGFPEDATFTTKFDYKKWGSDAHTPTWISGDELGEVVAWFDEGMQKMLRENAANQSIWYSCEHTWLNYLFGNGWRSRPEEIPEIEDVRFILWFDN